MSAQPTQFHMVRAAAADQLRATPRMRPACSAPAGSRAHGAPDPAQIDLRERAAPSTRRLIPLGLQAERRPIPREKAPAPRLARSRDRRADAGRLAHPDPRSGL